MIPATLTLIVAAAASTNALPLFSGLFAPRAVAPAPPATIQRRDLNNTQFAQGTNFFFSSLLLEAECTPGQVACIGGKTATCSAEANWEVTPCSEGTSCFAVPASTDPTDDSVVVKCMTQDEASTLLGTSNLSQDFQINSAPFNSTLTTPDPSDEPSGSNSDSDAPSATESGTDGPTPTNGDVDPTCTEDPEPTETETITVIAIPDPTNTSEFSFSTIFPTSTDDSDVPTSTTVAPSCATTYVVPDGASTTCDALAALFGITADDIYNANTFVDCDDVWDWTVVCVPFVNTSESSTASTPDATDSVEPTPTDSSTESPAPTDSVSEINDPTDSSTASPDPTDSPAPSDSDSASSTDTSPTTLSVPPALATPSTPVNAGSNPPEVSVVGTHFISASTPGNPPANLKMRKIRRW